MCFAPAGGPTGQEARGPLGTYHQRDGHLTSVLYPADAVRTHLGHLKVVLREITLKFYQYLEKVIFKFLP